MTERSAAAHIEVVREQLSEWREMLRDLNGDTTRVDEARAVLNRLVTRLVTVEAELSEGRAGKTQERVLERLVSAEQENEKLRAERRAALEDMTAARNRLADENERLRKEHDEQHQYAVQAVHIETVREALGALSWHDGHGCGTMGCDGKHADSRALAALHPLRTRYDRLV